MAFYVYILYSHSTHSFYKGQSSDITQRVYRHNAGREKSTARGVPWKLLWYTKKDSRSQAMSLERKLKNLSFQRTVDFMIKYHHDIAGADELLLVKQLSAC
ncbi:hypothetical protein C900_01500 [Fulvivirga imtechensis AK7]|uniref:GIY-YIG domain-containing protein n=1 Tax=Fulvivirga imtechensis AK7 TaxID=1237149 RepID=L8JIA5_9BACT|nr:GIY-YIG nuclease family protein [Fulvivirga imtechensis]ELR67978.1 hypothetical protein C900_01500 [Fulvivirga imtechensis AK7]